MVNNMLIDKKIKVLGNVISLFDQHQVIYAIGGSFMLYVHGIVDDFGDFDIMIKEDSIKMAKQILKRLGKVKEKDIQDPFYTEDFSSYLIDDVNFDLMSGLVIAYDGVCYRYILNQLTFKHKNVTLNFKLMICPLDDWYYLYGLMKRTVKQDLINQYLKNNITSYNSFIPELPYFRSID